MSLQKSIELLELALADMKDTLAKANSKVLGAGVCPLCGKHMDQHFVLIQPRLYPNIKRAIGWRCPDKEDPWPQG